MGEQIVLVTNSVGSLIGVMLVKDWTQEQIHNEVRVRWQAMLGLGAQVRIASVTHASKCEATFKDDPWPWHNTVYPKVSSSIV